MEEPEISGHYVFAQSPLKAGYERFEGHICEVDSIRDYDDPERVVVLKWLTREGGSLWDLESFGQDFKRSDLLESA